LCTIALGVRYLPSERELIARLEVPDVIAYG
jgi:hypothetical protein